ncbi:MAG: dihydrodipicolinate synthase family protein [Bryobacteraceae bacterium]
MSASYTRRQWLATAAGTAAALSARPAMLAADKPLRGIFIIVATPYTESNQIDYEDLAREIDFLDRCGVQGMVWPQLASDYPRLTNEERRRGMEVIAKAAKGKKPALVFGVQGANTKVAMSFVEKAESLAPDVLIAIPPTEAKTLDDFRSYYRAIARNTRRPLFIQTTGGAKGITPDIPFLVDLAKEFPHASYVKEEAEPVLQRMSQLAEHRPTIKGIFSGKAGRAMLYEMRLGFDGTMPGAPYSDIYAQIWNHYQAGDKDKAREIFAKLLLMIDLDQQVPGTRQYIMKRRGVFKTTASRRLEVNLSKEAIQEIEFRYQALTPYLKA